MSDGQEEQPPRRLYRDREEWRDVQPVRQDDGDGIPVCSIAYSPEFEDCMDYFRAVLRSEEKSERVLALIADVLMLNPANYTAWQYRREVMEEIGFSVEAEQRFVDEAALTNPKNYQIWHHRQWLLRHHRNPTAELDFTRRIFSDDSKNYHAWSHRQVVVAEFEQWSGEVAFVAELLNEDVRNNSAWNHRYFVLTRNNTVPLCEHDQLVEIEYASRRVNEDVENESPWNYVRGIVLPPSTSVSRVVTAPVTEAAYALCERIMTSNEGAVHARALFADLARARPRTSADTRRAVEALDALVALDPVRGKYWRYKKRELRRSVEGVAAASAEHSSSAP